MEPSERYVPDRWTRASGLGGRSNAWLAARPERLLAWWAILLTLGLAGLTLIVTAFFTAGWLLLAGIILLMPSLTLAPDVKYIPRAWSAWRNPGVH